MPKRGTFLLIVQTAVLANATRLAAQPDQAERHRHETSAAGVLDLMAAAVTAGERIPDALSAAEAAREFCRHRLDHLREDEERTTGTRTGPPSWLARA